MKLFSSLFFTLLLCFTSFSQRDISSRAVSCRIKIVNITVIPAHVDQVYENQDVILSCDGKITSISPHKALSQADSTLLEHFSNDSITRKIDGTGKFLIAAFSDAHIHLPKEEELARFFQLNILNGVTSMRSMRGEAWHLMINKDGYYTPKLYLSAPPVVDSTFADLDLLQKDLIRYKREGWDFVKLLSVDTASNYTKLQRMAKSAGVRIAGHAPHGVSIESLCNQGNFMSIEHLGGISDLINLDQIVAAIKRTNKANIYHCPTINWSYSFQFTTEELMKNKGLEYVSKTMIEAWDSELEKSAAGSSAEDLENFRIMATKHSAMMSSYLEFLYKQGSRILLSPDASGAYNIPGFSYHDEIQHFKKAGFSNREILKIASGNMAEMFGEGEEWGSLKVGATTDLLILNANPLADISNAQDIDVIIMRGQVLSASKLREELLKP
jgi:hypothetical protein